MFIGAEVTICIESMSAECVVFLDFVCLCCVTTHCVNSCTVRFFIALS